MKWIKRDASSTIAEVVERNTGVPITEFLDCFKDYDITNLNAAADCIFTAVQSNTPITIYGDFDADGITASTILYLTLAYLYSADTSRISVILPRRFSEGYGISMDRLAEVESGLLITVDNGISAIDEIRAAKDKGLQVIILDHHIPREDGKLPCADIIVDPHAISGGDFDGYCGAGLAFKLACLLIDDMNLLDRLSGLAAFGTVADVMPLVKDNRHIVLRGLANLNAGKNCSGVKGLLDALSLRYIDETCIAYTIAPVINASGRLLDDGAERVFKVLSGTEEYAKAHACELVENNERRKALVNESMERCEQLINENCLFGDNPLVVLTTASDKVQFHEGIIGILAGKLSEKYGVPAIVMCESSPGVLKGSGRSDGSVNLKELLDSVSEHIYKYGGHAGAAGLSVKLEKLDDFINALHDKMADVPASSSSDTLYYDLEITPSEVPAMIEELRKYAPFGEGNPAIVFKIISARLTPRAGKFYITMGKDGNMLKLYCKGFDAIGFGMVEHFKAIGEPSVLEMVGTLARKTFGEYGTTTLQVELMDIAKSNSLRAPTGLSMSLAEKMKTAGFVK